MAYMPLLPQCGRTVACRLLHTMFSPYKYIDATDLAIKLKQRNENPLTIAVIDVRGALQLTDDDFAGGNITGARNIPSSRFLDHVMDLANDLRSCTSLLTDESVVFHCALSQMRYVVADWWTQGCAYLLGDA